MKTIGINTHHVVLVERHGHNFQKIAFISMSCTATELDNFLAEHAHNTSIAIIEQTLYSDDQSSRKNYHSGYALGRIIGLLAAHSILCHLVIPTWWRKRMECGPSDRDTPYTMTQRYFPQLVSENPKLAVPLLLAELGFQIQGDETQDETSD